MRNIKRAISVYEYYFYTQKKKNKPLAVQTAAKGLFIVLLYSG